MFEFEPGITISDKCQGCGVQCEAIAQLRSLQFIKHMTGQFGESLVGDDGLAFDAIIDEQAPPEIANDIKQGVRRAVGEDLSDIDERIEKTKQDMAANELACNGILKMRASKGDVTYTVSLCTSPRVYNRDSHIPQHLPAHVRAESAYRHN